MLQDNVYDIDKTFDYDIIKAIVFSSLEKIAKEEAKSRSGISCGYSSVYHNPYHITQAIQPTPLLKLKIRNTTEYLKWRYCIKAR